MTPSQEKSLVEFLKLLSNPIRMSIYQLLVTGTHCNCELAEKLELSLSLISHHMRLMTESGLVVAQRDLEDARWIHYFIDQEILEKFRQELHVLLDPAEIQIRDMDCVKKSCQAIKKTNN